MNNVQKRQTLCKNVYLYPLNKLKNDQVKILYKPSKDCHGILLPIEHIARTSNKCCRKTYRSSDPGRALPGGKMVQQSAVAFSPYFLLVCLVPQESLCNNLGCHVNNILLKKHF